MTETKNVTLSELAGGGAIELIDAQVVKALENILDLQTDPRAKRVVNVKIELTPVGDDRNAVAVTVDASLKGAAYGGARSTIYFREYGGRIQAAEHHPQQEALFRDEPPARPAAVPPAQEV